MKNIQELEVHSSSFKDRGVLGKEFSFKGDNAAPALSWSNAPVGTKSYVVIVEDPDATTSYPWVHWLVFNIPAKQTSLTDPLGRLLELPSGIRQGMNSFNNIGYDGPSPAGVGHRYFFRVYALDIDALPTSAGSRKEDVLLAMEGHIIGKGHSEALFEG